MIISRNYAHRLVHQGKARLGGRTTTAPRWEERAYGKVYRIVERLDLQRVDHYLSNEC